MQAFFGALAIISGIAIIVAEALQTAKADGFSVITGMDSARFQPGTKEYMLERITRVAAVTWLLSCIAYAYLWYSTH